MKIEVSGYCYHCDYENDQQNLVCISSEVHHTISGVIFIGAEFRNVWWNADMYGEDVNLDGFMVTGIFGFSF